jgi:hypothetical protein
MRKRKTNAGLIKAALAVALVLMPMLALPASAQTPSSPKQVYQPFASAARTASANSSAQDVGNADTLVLYLSVTAGTGTSPTLDVKMQDSPDGGTTWFDIAGTAVTQVTGSSSSQVTSATRKFAKKLRCLVTIGGTTPSFTFAVTYMVYKA